MFSRNGFNRRLCFQFPRPIILLTELPRSEFIFRSPIPFLAACMRYGHLGPRHVGSLDVWRTYFDFYRCLRQFYRNFIGLNYWEYCRIHGRANRSHFDAHYRHFLPPTLHTFGHIDHGNWWTPFNVTYIGHGMYKMANHGTYDP